MQVNLVLLMAVAFLPFPTKLVAEAIRGASAERAAVIFYGAWLLVISGSIQRVMGHGRERPRAAQTRRERERGQCDRPGDDTEPRVLRRCDRTRVHRPKSGRVRVPRDRDRRHSASPRRQSADTDDTRVCVNPPSKLRPNRLNDARRRRRPVAIRVLVRLRDESRCLPRGDAKELGETLEAGEASLVVIGESRVGEQLNKALTHAEKSVEKEVDADSKDFKADLEDAQKDLEKQEAAASAS